MRNRHGKQTIEQTTDSLAYPPEISSSKRAQNVECPIMTLRVCMMYVCMFACMYVYAYVCMYACVQVCKYVCTVGKASALLLRANAIGILGLQLLVYETLSY